MSNVTDLAPVTADAINALAAFADDAASGTVNYLKFSKGDFVYGPEEATIDPEERFAVDISSLKRGFICWGDGAVLGEEMKPVTQGAVNEDSLEDYSDQGGEWRDQTSIEFTSMEDGQVFLFKTSSYGGRKAIAEVVSKFAQRAKRGETSVVPVITMLAGSYKHKSYGKVHVPVFEVVDWLQPGQSDHSNDPVQGEIVEDDDIPFDRPAPAKRAHRRAS